VPLGYRFLGFVEIAAFGLENLNGSSEANFPATSSFPQTFVNGLDKTGKIGVNTNRVVSGRFRVGVFRPRVLTPLYCETFGKVEGLGMALFEIETDGHIVITWATDEQAAREVVADAFPYESVRRLVKRPRDSWVISKSALGLMSRETNPCVVARECLQSAGGDKVRAVRLYMNQTGDDLDTAKKAIESNMAMGW